MDYDSEGREFHDRFVKKKEEKDHAMSVTVGILIFIAIMAASAGISYVLISRQVIPMEAVLEPLQQYTAQTEAD